MRNQLKARRQDKYIYPNNFKDKLNSLEKIKNINTAHLILHGNQDKIVPFQQGRTLFEEANSPKTLIYFAKGAHNDLWTIPDFFVKIKVFIKTHCNAFTCKTNNP